MVGSSDQLIQGMVDAIVCKVEPQRIYVFGSRAQGTHTTDSDVDLLIVEGEPFGPGRRRWAELKRIRKILKPFRVPKDILIYDQDEFKKWRNSINHIVARAMREGQLVYERP